VKIADIGAFLKIGDWKRYLGEKTDQRVVGLVRANTRAGRPSGSDEFVEKLEEKLNRRLRTVSIGRPGREI